MDVVLLCAYLSDDLYGALSLECLLTLDIVQRLSVADQDEGGRHLAGVYCMALCLLSEHAPGLGIYIENKGE